MVQSNYLTNRIRAFFATLIGIAIGIGAGVFGVQGVLEYFNFTDVIIYIRGLVLFLFMPFFFAIVTIFQVYVLIHGRELPNAIGVMLVRAIIFIAISGLVTSVTFSIWYSSQLEDKGYIKCKGVPTGYMPFMAVKYVVFESMCKKAP